MYKIITTSIFILVNIFVIKNIIQKHGNLINWLDVQLYTPTFNLNHKENCYELRPNGLLMMKTSYTTIDLSSKAPANGSFMYVAGADFDQKKYFYQCRQFKGYLTFKYGGIGVWYLTDVK